jgi:NAD(P)-dependent dehydrogenase (short-subunit alcohol dehydrogenase family)
METQTLTPDLFSLEDRVVVLTGGAGLYGRGLAAQLAEAGATLVLASRDTEALDAVCAEERERGYAVTAEFLDLEDPASIEALHDIVLEEHGRIDGLVNNAVARPMKGPDDELASWETSMRINATGLFAISRVFGDAMAARSAGSMVNIGSIQGMIGPDLSLYEGLGMQTVPDYFFHKGGMENLTRYFASIYGPKGVRVNCVAPGGFANNQPAKFVKRYNAKTFLGRMAGPRDLGGAVVFLLSDAAGYITGANLPVDGGYTAN